MPLRVPWDPADDIGDAAIDAQHQALLAQCNRLADLCEADDGANAKQAFDEAYAQLKALAHQHFETETARLAEAGDAGHAGLEDHQAECEEFDYLADEIATTANFDRLELQRFVALWWVGHVKGTAGRHREVLGGGGAGGAGAAG